MGSDKVEQLVENSCPLCFITLHMFRFTLSLVTCLLWLNPSLAQIQLSKDPNNVNIITTDLDNFWRAYDLAKGKRETEQEDIYQKMYIDEATVGFKSYLKKRDKEVGELVKGINTMIPFYESIRENTLLAKDYEKEIRAGFYALKYLYPDAVFPEVYCFIWYFLKSGSTVSDKGLLIAMETQATANDTPLDKFPEIHHPMIRSMNLQNLAALIVHESIHMQQPNIKTESLLARAIKEGSADFLAELATGHNPSQSVHDMVNPKERELWAEFKGVMRGNKNLEWIHTIPKDRPAGLGYWMGYKIVNAYYQKQPDKQYAIKQLLTTTDYEAIYKESGYSDQFD